jgi:hypothetical protein
MVSEEVPAPSGRPSKYKGEETDKQARKLCMLGATDEDLANFFEVAVTTIDNWKKEHDGFLGSLKESKDELDAQVVRSLFQRAKGYNCPDTKFATHEGQITDSQTYTKHYPPDTTACIFWLKNRQKADWRDKTEIETNPSEEIAEVLKEVAKKLPN